MKVIIEYGTDRLIDSITFESTEYNDSPLLCKVIEITVGDHFNELKEKVLNEIGIIVLDKQVSEQSNENIDKYVYVVMEYHDIDFITSNLDRAIYHWEVERGKIDGMRPDILRYELGIRGKYKRMTDQEVQEYINRNKV